MDWILHFAAKLDSYGSGVGSICMGVMYIAGTKRLVFLGRVRDKGRQNHRKMTYEQEKAEVLAKLKELMELYTKFTTLTSPTYWRTTGFHFGELRKMKNDIPNFTAMTKEEHENEWVKEALMKDKFKLQKPLGTWKAGRVFDSFGGIVSGVRCDKTGQIVNFTDTEYFKLV